MKISTRLKNIIRTTKYMSLYGVVVGVIYMSNLVPRRLWLKFCSTLGNVVFYFAPSMRHQVQANLSNAFKGELTHTDILSLSKRVIIMLFKNAGVVLREFLISSADFNKHNNVYGLEHAEKAFLSGRGVIFLTAHIGPFECVAHELSIRGYHPFIIGTPLKGKMLNHLVNTNRTRFGGVVIERGKETFRVMKNIRAGGTMAILIDQDTTVKSVIVDFFGMPCSTPAGAAIIALKTGAAVVPVFSHLKENGEHEINYYNEVALSSTGNDREDIIRNTQTLTSIIEREVRLFPEQWVWMHRRWKTKMPQTATLM